MASWGNRRKFAILGIFFLLVLMAGGFIGFKLFYKPPTCSDGAQNQGEAGIDCGGPCAPLCAGQAEAPIVLWQRLFNIDTGIYTAAALIQNPNLSAGAKDVPYRIRVLDENGISIYEKRGTIDIYPKYTFPVIEPGLVLGDKVPERVTFEFLSDPMWTKEQEKITQVTLGGDRLFNEETRPRIEAKLQNRTARDIQGVKVGVIAYDKDGNALGVSRTVVDTVPAEGEATAVFTWPRPFAAAVARKEIVILE